MELIDTPNPNAKKIILPILVQARGPHQFAWTKIIQKK